MSVMVRVVSVCVCCLLLLIPKGQADAEPAAEPETGLIVGLRSNVRPFSYTLQRGVIDTDATRGPLGRAGYTGYMVRICDAALSEMLVDPQASGLSPGQVQIYDIDKQVLLGKEGKPELAGGEAEQEQIDPRVKPTTAETSVNDPVGKRFDDLGVKYDILCDPATMTNARRGMIVSAPVFLTGISYLSPENQTAPDEPCGLSGENSPATTAPQDATYASKSDASMPRQPANADPVRPGDDPSGKGEGQNVASADKGGNRRALFGLVAGTTSQDRGIRALIDAREMPKFEEQMFAALRDDKEGPKACKNGTTLIKDYPNHTEAARKFCEGQEFYYYLGDLEIIRSYAESNPGCKFDNGAVTYTNDRYAVFGRPIGSGSAAKPENTISPPVETPSSTAASKRELIVARFFSILTQKVIFNPSVLDKAYDDTFPGQPQSRKLKLFYWSIRGERLPEIQPDNAASPPPKQK